MTAAPRPHGPTRPRRASTRWNQFAHLSLIHVGGGGGTRGTRSVSLTVCIPGAGTGRGPGGRTVAWPQEASARVLACRCPTPTRAACVMHTAQGPLSARPRAELPKQQRAHAGHLQLF